MLDHEDIVQVIDEQELNGERILNIFYYIVSVFTAGVTLLELLLEFRDIVVVPMRAIQHVDLEHIKLHANNLTNGLDEEDLVMGLAGTDSAGEALNTFTAAAFTLIVGSKLTRNGSKRIAGISEGRVTGNIYTGGAGLDEDLSDAMSEVLQVSGTPSGELDAYPAVIGRDLLGELILANWNGIVTCSVKTNITSQTSRKQVI